MVTVKIQGGLGNQMFEYACARALSLHQGTGLRVDPASLFDITPRKWRTPRNYALDIVFNLEPKLNLPARIQRAINIPYAATVFNKYYPRFMGKLGHWHYLNYMDNAHHPFDPSIFELRGDVYLDGYWRSEKYFKKYSDVIRKDFTFRHELEGETAKIADQIRVAKNAVCLHVRRGDNIWNKASQKTHILSPMDHFERAIAIMKQKIGDDMTVFIFSDDMPWCCENLRLHDRQVFVGEEHAGVEARDHLQLMSLCKHFIMPESTFSWWAAWLSTYKDKVVICPDVMFKDASIPTKDMIPEEWIRI
jgi:hypothetical protein